MEGWVPSISVAFGIDTSRRSSTSAAFQIDTRRIPPPPLLFKSMRDSRSEHEKTILSCSAPSYTSRDNKTLFMGLFVLWAPAPFEHNKTREDRPIGVSSCSEGAGEGAEQKNKALGALPCASSTIAHPRCVFGLGALLPP